MRPLILHNVPDDELYTGEDGVQRPYAMIFPDGDRQPGPRARRPVAESGSFGKSTRRSRSRTGSAPPRGQSEHSMIEADKIFSKFIQDSEKQADTATTSQRKPSYLSQSAVPDDATSTAQPPRVVKQPTEVILRGYRSQEQQYAAINHYEQLAGRICEDYPREPPVEMRRYKSELRDPAFTRSQVLTPEERTKVNKVDGGEHWVKVTFESADVADAAIFASPQHIMGYLIYAEPYRGVPPKEDAAVYDLAASNAGMIDPQSSQLSRSLRGERRPSSSRSGKGSTLPKSWTTPLRATSGEFHQDSPPGSQTSTQTIESTTVSNSTSTATTATVSGTVGTSTGFSPFDNVVASPDANQANEADSAYCKRIPTARRAKIMPAEQALLPKKTLSQQVVDLVPILKWFGGSMIGSEVPRTESGDFDLAKASLYWQLMFYLDLWFRLFGGEIVGGDKDD